MKNVHEFISALDDAKYGNQVTEDKAPVAPAPSHAPTSTAQWKTPSSGKSDDQGERTGGEKDAIKKSNTAIPAPVGPTPSHAPTSTAQWKTKGGEGHSEDEGEKVSKEAMKENLMQQIIDAETADDIQAIMAEADLSEAGHPAGCTCGFCRNKGKFGKKDSEKSAEAETEDKGDVAEAHRQMRRPPYRMPIRRRLGGERLGFRHPAATAPSRPKAASLPGGTINPNQPAMEKLDTSDDPTKTIQEMADQLLEAPDFE
jgi:hypothetical protein